MPSTGVMSHPSFMSLPKTLFNSPGLSLALANDLEGKGDELSRIMGDLDSVGRGNEEEEHEIKSGSDNLDVLSGDDLEQENPRKKKKRYHRHTPQLIQELEALFKESPHPDENFFIEMDQTSLVLLVMEDLSEWEVLEISGIQVSHPLPFPINSLIFPNPKCIPSSNLISPITLHLHCSSTPQAAASAPLLFKKTRCCFVCFLSSRRPISAITSGVTVGRERR